MASNLIRPVGRNRGQKMQGAQVNDSCSVDYALSSHRRKPTRRERLRDRARTIIHNILPARQRNLNFPSNSEGIVKVKMTATGRRDAVDGDVLDVRRDTSRYCLLYGALVEVVHCDSRAGVEECIVNGVLGREGRENE